MSLAASIVPLWATRPPSSLCRVCSIHHVSSLLVRSQPRHQLRWLPGCLRLVHPLQDSRVLVRTHWLPHQDLNLDKVIQSHLCYRYTMWQENAHCSGFHRRPTFPPIRLPSHSSLYMTTAGLESPRLTPTASTGRLARQYRMQKLVNVTGIEPATPWFPRRSI